MIDDWKAGKTKKIEKIVKKQDKIENTEKNDNRKNRERRPVLQKLSGIPELPGIYQMIDSRGTIIYIGKSKCLKKRVHSYFVESPRWEKAARMAPFIYDINYIVTDTHLEAMLLECEMIKQMKPHFNVLMKNDERYVYLTVSRRMLSDKLLSVTYARENISFGPFRSRSQVQEFADSMENLYPFTEKRKRIQFEYHILPQKLTGSEREETARLLEKLFLDSEVMRRFQKELEKRMKQAAGEEKFELAVKYRDLLKNTGYIWKNLRDYNQWMNRQFVYTEETPEGRKYFFIDDGMVIYKAMQEKNFQEKIWWDKFVQEGKRVLAKQRSGILKGSAVSADLTEKQKVDYQDIVLSECMRNLDAVIPIF